VWAPALWSRPCGKQHFRDLPTPDWASPSTTITYCSVYMTRSQVPAQSGVGKSRKCCFPHGVACTRPVQCHRPATNACMDLFPHCTGFHLLFFIPRSSFGRGNFMLPKRRFWKVGWTFQKEFSKHFSTIRGPNLVLTSLEKCFENYF
jgi:hypothetical protein